MYFLLLILFTIKDNLQLRQKILATGVLEQENIIAVPCMQ